VAHIVEDYKIERRIVRYGDGSDAILCPHSHDISLHAVWRAIGGILNLSLLRQWGIQEDEREEEAGNSCCCYG
jgi:hypothetical protein